MSESVQVETVHGKLRGRVENGVRCFKGVRYARPPVGSRRFMAPEPPEPWAGTREALAFGNRALQQDNSFGFPPELLRLFFVGEPPPMSEDCLYLNVWTPAAGDGGKRPVLVWLHVGAFIAGSGSAPWNDGANLARSGDVVVVTLNHRLGAFGYLQLAELGGETYADSGVAGMLDLVAALGWVRDNIAQFGGDAGNVTIFGESGGGAKVAVMMAMPGARGLFHKAIIQSGPAVAMATPEDGALPPASCWSSWGSPHPRSTGCASSQRSRCWRRRTRCARRSGASPSPSSNAAAMASIR